MDDDNVFMYVYNHNEFVMYNVHSHAHNDDTLMHNEVVMYKNQNVHFVR